MNTCARAWRLRAVYFCSTGILLASLPSAVWAADAPAAAGKAAEATRVEEVVVTAQKFEQRLQDTPVAITAFTAKSLEQHLTTSITDLQLQTPSLQFRTSTTDNMTPLVSLRGQAQTRGDLGKQPSVGLYQDGVYALTTAGITAAGGMLDVERVEVLAGPQGTLYGRNTPGGAINIISKLPTSEFGGQFQGIVGNEDLYNINGVLNIPMAEGVGLRLVGQFQRDGGYGEDIAHHSSTGDVDVESLRGTFRAQPNDRVDVVLRADFTHARSGGNIAKVAALKPGSLAVLATAAKLGLPFTADGLSQAYNALLATNPAGKYDSNLSLNQMTDVKQWGVSATVGYVLDDTWSIKSISAYRGLKKVADEDDPFPVEILECAQKYALTQGNCVNVRADQYTQELQLVGNLFDNRLKSLSGAFFYYGHALDNLEYGVIPALNPTTPSLDHATITDRSWAIFHQSTLAVTDRLNFTGGVRYTSERVSMLANNYNAGPAGSCQVPVADRIGGQCLGEYGRKFTNWSWTFGADLKATDAVLLYAKASRGFKAGGVNTLGSSLPGSFTPFDPEVATQYEAGIKSEWLDGRVRANLAAYYTDYQDIQRNVTVFVPPSNTASVTLNAASGVIEGVEAQLTVIPVEGLQLSGTASYIDAYYKKYVDNGVDKSGNVFPAVPKWQLSASAVYTVPVGVGDLQFGVDWYWQSKVVFDPDNHSAFSGATGLQDAYSLFNGRIALDFAGQDLQIAVWGKNLTNEYYLAGALDVTAALGYGANYYAPPRTFGLMVTKKF